MLEQAYANSLAVLIGRVFCAFSPIVCHLLCYDKVLGCTPDHDTPPRQRVPVRRAVFRAHRRDKGAASWQPGIRRGASFHGNDGANSQAIRRGPRRTRRARPQARERAFRRSCPAPGSRPLSRSSMFKRLRSSCPWDVQSRRSAHAWAPSSFFALAAARALTSAFAASGSPQ